MAKPGDGAAQLPWEVHQVDYGNLGPAANQGVCVALLALLQRAGEEGSSLVLELRQIMLDTAGSDATVREAGRVRK